MVVGVLQRGGLGEGSGDSLPSVDVIALRGWNRLRFLVLSTLHRNSLIARLKSCAFGPGPTLRKPRRVGHPSLIGGEGEFFSSYSAVSAIYKKVPTLSQRTRKNGAPRQKADSSPLKRIRNDKYLKAGSRRGAPRNDKCVKADSLRLREKSPHPGG